MKTRQLNLTKRHLSMASLEWHFATLFMLQSLPDAHRPCFHVYIRRMRLNPHIFILLPCIPCFKAKSITVIKSIMRMLPLLRSTCGGSHNCKNDRLIVSYYLPHIDFTLHELGFHMKYYFHKLRQRNWSAWIYELIVSRFHSEYK